jgi:predicted enzyme related to lactoylglutathione lyase
VTLWVSIEEALRRVEADTGRRTSHIPDLLRASHADFSAAPPIPGDLRIDSTSCPVDDVVAMIKQGLQRNNIADTAVQALFRDVDCIQISVPDLESGLAFYRDALGQDLIWRMGTAAGLSLSDSAVELVIQTERSELEANLSVASANTAARRFVEAGGTLLVGPFDIAIGRCAVVRDPGATGSSCWTIAGVVS